MEQIEKDLYCELCSLQFEKKYIYDTHLKIIHGTEIIKIKVKENAIKEEEFETNENETSFKCNICDANYNDKVGLKHHKDTVHGEQKIKCRICDHKYSKNYLIFHIRTVHEGDRFKCDL